MNTATPPANFDLIVRLNTVIAKFMKLEVELANTSFNPGRYNKYLLNGRWLTALHLRYNSSWDALKPAIDKAFTYAIAYPDLIEKLRQMSVVSEIGPVYEEVFKIADWLIDNNAIL